MPIKLLRFPFLVQKLIFEEIDLLCVLSITMLSKRSRATASACLRHHKYNLSRGEDWFQFERMFSNEDGNTLFIRLLGPKSQSSLGPPYQLWRIGNQEVPIKSTNTEEPNGTILTHINVFSDNSLDFSIETLQYLSRLLPKLNVTLHLGVSNAEIFRRTLQSVESLEEIEEINAVGPSWHRIPVYHDELTKLVLDECRRARKLRVAITTTDNFVYPTSMPFNFDSIEITKSEWVSREQFIKLFLSCKTVDLRRKNFEYEDLTAIFKAWTEGSRLEYMHLEGIFSFYFGKTLGSVFKEFPGAAPVRKALVPKGLNEQSQLVLTNFDEGECYLIQQSDGQTTALVYIDPYTVMLSTNFQIGKEVDEMAARIEEERLLRQHPLDENMEAEE